MDQSRLNKIGVDNFQTSSRIFQNYFEVLVGT
jgi:hypothetical protein